MYVNNCVFHCLHKEIDNAFFPGANYSFRELLAYVISQIRNTNRRKKILDNVFQLNCSSYAKLRTNLRKMEKQPKIRHRSVMHSALQLFLSNIKLTLIDPTIDILCPGKTK